MTAILEFGANVTRAIPAEFWTGVAAGKYTMHGGVVRNLAGQIVAHLALPASEIGMPALSAVMPGPVAVAGNAVSVVSGLVANAQLVSLSRDIHQVLNVAMIGTGVAGLGLATSMLGFWYLNRRLGHVEDKVTELKVAVEKLKKILETADKARLLSAINTYKLACNNASSAQREQLLLKARSDFDQLTFFYEGMARSCTDIAEVEAAEGFFIVACLGDAVCTSDLGMYADAAENLKSHFLDWQKLARKHCIEFLELENPARLLEGRYVKDLPTTMLTRVLDFANDEHRGIEWIDVLRGPLGAMRWPISSTIAREKIEFAKVLCERNDVIGGYVDHFGLLAELQAPATEYARQLMHKTKEGHAVLNWVKPSAITAA